MRGSSSRREFLKTASAGAAALTLSASSYARVSGANDRISVGVIGCGQRGFGAHMPGVHKHAQSQNVEITAVCDPWRVPRERAAAQVKQWYGRPARQFVSYRDVMALKDVDAVMIALLRPPAHYAPGSSGRGQEGCVLREAAGDGFRQAQEGL